MACCSFFSISFAIPYPIIKNRSCLFLINKLKTFIFPQVLGGTSVFNGMMYMRGSKQDYDNWAQAGNPGWSFDEILPYFIKSEDNKQVYYLNYFRYNKILNDGKM